MKKKILITDDDRDSAAILDKILKADGYKVSINHLGKDCLEELRKNPYDLLLLDVILPDVLGTDLCVKIKSNPLFGNLKIILISGKKITNNDRAFGFDVGASAYMSKPFEKEELLHAVKETLENGETSIRGRGGEEFSSFTIDTSTITSKIYNQDRIESAYPEEFEKLADKYQRIIELAIDQRIYKTDHNISGLTKELSLEFGFLKANAYDLIAVHKKTLQKLLGEVNYKRDYYIREESKILLIELMGYLMNYYRKLSAL